jgi:hypothetical protein
MGMTHHMHLLDLASFGNSNAAVNSVDDLLHPWTVTTKVIQDVPSGRYRSCSFLMLGGCAIASMRVPPAAPARVMRFARGTRAFVFEVTGVKGSGVRSACL